MSTLPIGNFRPFKHAVSVDQAVMSLLRKWLPTYLRQTEIHEEKPTRWLARPRAYTTVYSDDDEDFYSDKMMPTVVVSTDAAQGWEQAGDLWMAHYATTVTIISRGRSMPESRLQSALQIATVTELLLNKAGLEGFANGIRPTSERVRAILDPSNRSRHLTAGTGVYDILVADIRRGLGGGPLDPDPPDDPDTGYDPYPPVEVTTDFDWHSPADPIEEE